MPKLSYRGYDPADVSEFNFRDVLDIPEVSIHGLYKPHEIRKYMRLPDALGKSVNEGVANLQYNTAGGRLRFATDADEFALRVTQNYIGLMNHMDINSSSGFDVYVKEGSLERFIAVLTPQLKEDADAVHLIKLPKGHKEITINMPLYNGFDKLELGLREGDAVAPHVPYSHALPIVYYGSSITQGACSSRPGICYQARISRKYDTDFINLGFSGSARGEDNIAEYMANLEMSAFVSDYDHNAPDTAHLLATHKKLYETIRAKHQDIPYIIVGKPDVDIDYSERRCVVFDTYEYAIKSGDRKVYYIDSYQLFSGEGRYDCTVDGCHPNDVGFERMADVIGTVIARALKF